MHQRHDRGGQLPNSSATRRRRRKPQRKIGNVQGRRGGQLLEEDPPWTKLDGEYARR